MGVELDDPRIAGYTVGVWVTEKFGRLPEEDESFVYGKCEITVEKVSKTRILSVIIHILEDQDAGEAKTGKGNSDGTAVDAGEAEK